MVEKRKWSKGEFTMHDGDGGDDDGGDDDGVGWLKGKSGQKENSQCVGWN